MWEEGGWYWKRSEVMGKSERESEEEGLLIKESVVGRRIETRNVESGKPNGEGESGILCGYKNKVYSIVVSVLSLQQ